MFTMNDFKDGLVQYEAEVAKSAEELNGIREAYQRRLTDIYLAARPADAKLDKDKLLTKMTAYFNQDRLAAVIAPYREQTTAAIDRHRERADLTHRMLMEIALAVEMPIVKDAKTFIYKSVAYNYSTQTNAIGYARGKAEIYKEFAESMGLTVEIIGKNEYAHNGEVDTFLLQANTSLDGAALFNYKTNDLFEQFIEACFRKALNPIVYYSFLPWFYNSKATYDAYIKELAEKAAKVKSEE